MDTKDLEKRVNNIGGRSITYWKNGVLVGKRCTVCGEDKSIESFGFRDKKKGIYRADCKECRSKYYKQWRDNNNEHIEEYKEKNKKYLKELRKQWRENNKEYRQKYNKQWRKENKEKAKELTKQWRENNKEYIREWSKQYRENNKDKLKERAKQRFEYIKKENVNTLTETLNQLTPILNELNIKAYGSIYKFENIKTGRCYIGQTITPLKYRYRGSVVKGWIEERKHYQNQKFTEELIEEDFIYTEILDVGCCKWHLDKLEAYYINEYDSCNNGYNNNAGPHITDDGIEEFNQILKENGLEFENGKLIQIKNTHHNG